MRQRQLAITALLKPKIAAARPGTLVRHNTAAIAKPVAPLGRKQLPDDPIPGHVMAVR